MLTWITKAPLMCPPRPICDYLSYADLHHPDHCCSVRMYVYQCLKVISIYADLDHQGTYCDHQDSLCDHLSYADLDHPDHCCYVRICVDHCLKVIFIYADLDPQGPFCDHLSYADLDNQGPYCDHQDSLCDHLSYADLDHPHHRCYIRMYVDHCLKVIFFYADLDHQGRLI